MRALTVSQVRRQIEIMEIESRRFYEVALARTGDAGTRRLLGDLALAEVCFAPMIAVERGRAASPTQTYD